MYMWLWLVHLCINVQTVDIKNDYRLQSLKLDCDSENRVSVSIRKNTTSSEKYHSYFLTAYVSHSKLARSLSALVPLLLLLECRQYSCIYEMCEQPT